MSVPFPIHLDENCNVALAHELRQYDVDVTTTYEVKLDGSIHRTQLAHAGAERRVMVSHDVDMMKLHTAGLARHGLIFIKMNRWTVIEMTEGILRIREEFDRGAMIGRLVKLADYL